MVCCLSDDNWISHEKGLPHNGGGTQAQRIMCEFARALLWKALPWLAPCGINNCVKRAPITLVQPPLREYIGAKFGVVG